MNIRFLLAASALALSMPAQALVVFSDNFDAEGATKLNFAGFANWDVLEGTVDLISQTHGITCNGGAGSCVDLDGSTGNPGILITKQSFSNILSDDVSLQFAASGSQRSGLDSLIFGLLYTDGTIVQVPVGPLASNVPFNLYGASGSTGYAGTFRLFFRADPDTPGSDNVGLILDDVVLAINPAGVVPEPATWAMMIGGFALVGSAMRRRTSAVSFA